MDGNIIPNNQYKFIYNRLKNKIIKILFLLENHNNIEEVHIYINKLIIEISGCYYMSNNVLLLNVICEIKGIDNNLSSNVLRSKILDVANFVGRMGDEIDN